MIEIIAIWIFCRDIGKLARSRNLKPRPFQVRAVVLWFVFEFIGIMVGIFFGLPLVLLNVVGLACACVSLHFSFAAVRRER
jgi:hypothetical protein